MATLGVQAFGGPTLSRRERARARRDLVRVATIGVAGVVVALVLLLPASWFTTMESGHQRGLRLEVALVLSLVGAGAAAAAWRVVIARAPAFRSSTRSLVRAMLLLAVPVLAGAFVLFVQALA